MATTFRTLGQNIATGQFLFTIENLATSAVTVYVRRLVVQMDATAVLTAVMPQVKVFRFTPAAGGGTTLAKGTFDSAQASSTLVQLRGATASDGGAAVTLTTITPGTMLWQQYCMRLHTAVGQVLAPDNNLLPALVDQVGVFDFKLLANEALGVQIVTAASVSNPATNFWFVNCVWTEG